MNKVIPAQVLTHTVMHVASRGPSPDHLRKALMSGSEQTLKQAHMKGRHLLVGHGASSGLLGASASSSSPSSSLPSQPARGASRGRAGSQKRGRPSAASKDKDKGGKDTTGVLGNAMAEAEREANRHALISGLRRGDSAALRREQHRAVTLDTLRDSISAVAKERGLRVGADVVELMSLAVQEKLKTVLSVAVERSRWRIDDQEDAVPSRTTSDPGGAILKSNQRDENKRLAKVRRQDEAAVSLAQDESGPSRKKRKHDAELVQRGQELLQRRQQRSDVRSANAAALALAGGSMLSFDDDFGNGGASSSAAAAAADPSAGARDARQAVVAALDEQRERELKKRRKQHSLTVADVLAYMEASRRLAKSTLLYKSYLPPRFRRG